MVGLIVCAAVATGTAPLVLAGDAEGVARIEKEGYVRTNPEGVAHTPAFGEWQSPPPDGVVRIRRDNPANAQGVVRISKTPSMIAPPANRPVGVWANQAKPGPAAISNVIPSTSPAASGAVATQTSVPVGVAKTSAAGAPNKISAASSLFPASAPQPEFVSADPKAARQGVAPVPPGNARKIPVGSSTAAVRLKPAPGVVTAAPVATGVTTASVAKQAAGPKQTAAAVFPVEKKTQPQFAAADLPPAPPIEATPVVEVPIADLPVAKGDSSPAVETQVVIPPSENGPKPFPSQAIVSDGGSWGPSPPLVEQHRHAADADTPPSPDETTPSEMAESMPESTPAMERSLSNRLRNLNRPVNDIDLAENYAEAPQDPDNIAKAMNGGLPAVGVWGSPLPVTHPTRYVYNSCHNPLYYQDVNLERCGRGHGCWQPLVSAADFAGRTLILPYMMVSKCPGDCECTLGDCPTCHQFPECSGIPDGTYEGVAVEAAVVTAAVLLMML
jgi:hypothetical protein